MPGVLKALTGWMLTAELDRETRGCSSTFTKANRVAPECEGVIDLQGLTSALSVSVPRK